MTPSRGQILFDGVDITPLSTQKRNIAQVFQFPVIYDTMTVGQNLAFPLKNRGVAKAEIDARGRARSPSCSISTPLSRPARRRGLTADAKQKISLGRGLVRSDVAAVLFDEPLTVIDPELKWQLRSKLKALHRELELTMIYVTHDQTEALTFADTVVVMHDGRVVQSGTPAELFDKPAHTFVGYFIGSPGMNIVPAEVRGREARIGGHTIALNRSYDGLPAGAQIEIGVRPEFVDVAPPGAGPAVGQHRADRRSRAHPLRARARRRREIRGTGAGGSFGLRTSRRARVRSVARSRLRRQPSGRGELLMDKTVNQKAWFLVLPVFLVRGVLGDPAADDGGELFDAGHLRQQPVLLERRRLVQGTARSLDRSRRAVLRIAVAQPVLLRRDSGDRGSARHRGRAVDAAPGLERRRLPRDPGAAAADPVERGRHDLADLRAARHRPARLCR